MGEPAFLDNPATRTGGSLFDHRLHKLVPLLAELLCRREVFHVQLFFHSGQMLLWRVGHPCHFETYTADAVLARDFLGNFDCRETDGLTMPPHEVARTLVKMSVLRRQGKLLGLGINRANGMVGSSDLCGHASWQHYREFLAP